MKIRPSILSGGGRFDELSNRIDNTKDELNNSINSTKTELNNKINTVQNTANYIYNDYLPKSYVTCLRTITDDSRAMSARENNPSVIGSLRYDLSELMSKVYNCINVIDFFRDIDLVVGMNHFQENITLGSDNRKVLAIVGFYSADPTAISFRNVEMTLTGTINIYFKSEIEGTRRFFLKLLTMRTELSAL